MTERHDDFDQRLRLAMEELAASNIPAAQHYPPLQRALRRLGVRMRPPLYQPLSVNIALFGVPFGVFMGLAVWLMPGLMGNPPGAVIVLMSALGGVLFGWLMGRSSRRDARAAGLTDWDDLLPSDNTA